MRSATCSSSSTSSGIKSRRTQQALVCHTSKTPPYHLSTTVVAKCDQVCTHMQPGMRSVKGGGGSHSLLRSCPSSRGMLTCAQTTPPHSSPRQRWPCKGVAIMASRNHHSVSGLICQTYMSQPARNMGGHQTW
jgi:hypothetical protein